MKALNILNYIKEKNDISFISKTNIDEAIAELEKVESKSCRNCTLDFSFCEIFYGVNSRICINPDGFNCSLHNWKK